MEKKNDFDPLSSLNSPVREEGREQTTLHEYIGIFRRRRIVVLQAFALVFSIGVVITLFTVPTYRATAYLLIDPPSYRVNQVDASDPLGPIGDNPTYKIETQVRLLQGKRLLNLTEKKIGDKLPNISVKSIRDTEMIEVAAEGPKAELAAKAANALLETYLDEIADINGEQIKKGLTFTEDGAKKAQRDLENTEKKLRDFKQRYRVVELEKDREAQVGVVNTLTTRYDELQAKLASVRSQIAVTRRQMLTEPKVEDTAIPDATDPAVQATENQLVALEAQRSGLLKRYTPVNQKVAALDAQIAILRKELLQQRTSSVARNKRINPAFDTLRDNSLQLERDASGLATEAATTSKRLVEARQRLSSFPSWEQELAGLQRLLEISKTNYTLFSSKREDLRLREQTRRVNARITEMATVPTFPVRPNRVQNIVFAAFLGMVLGLILALLQEYLDDRINSVEEADRILQLPNLGLIPRVEEEGLRRLRGSDTFSPLTESYRGLRTNINFASVDNPARTLMVTSTGPGEGKSTSAANLATIMAMDGRRVILVDGDLRRPTAHQIFKLRLTPGLTDLLIGTHTISQVLQQTDVPNVSVITAGTHAPNPAELLGSEAMAHFVDAIREAADVVIFDSPPALAVADAALLSARVDGVVFVVSYGETKRTNARQAISMLARARANILGTVINKLDEAGMGYYGTYTHAYTPITSPEATKNGHSTTALTPVNGKEPRALSDERTVPEEKS